MKKVVLFALFNLFILAAFAQDIIYMSGGNEIKGLVTSVTEREVQFSLWSDEEDGGVFIVPMRKVDKIKFANGVEVDYEALRMKQKKELRKVSSGERGMVSSVPTPITDSANATPMNVLSNIENMTYNSYREHQLERKYGYIETARILKLSGLILGIANGVFTFAKQAVVSTNAGDMFLAAGQGILQGVVSYWVPWGIIAAVFNSNAKMIHTASLYERDFEIGGLQMTSGINLMHDNVVNSNAMGVGLNINL